MLPDNSFTVYILDANAIRELDYKCLKTSLKIMRIITTEDVKFEVNGLSKAELVPTVSLNGIVFTKMRELIANHGSIQVLISYVENKGTADIGIVAYALTASEGKLIKDEFVVITQDSNLRNACDEFKVTWMSVSDFKLKTKV